MGSNTITYNNKLYNISSISGFSLRCTAYSTKSFKDSTILKPVLSAKLLAPIVYNDNILFNLKHCDKIFAALPNNTVHKFLMEELNDKQIIVCAEVKNDLINNYIEEVSKIRHSNKDGVASKVNSKTIYKNEIARNNNCYNSHVETPFIEFELGQFCTALYFSYILVIIPLVSAFENILIKLSFTNKYSIPCSHYTILNANLSVAGQRNYST